MMPPLDPLAAGRPPQAPRRVDWRFAIGHPARWLAFGFGSGLSRWAPGTVGTLWAWLAFRVLDPWLSDAGWAGLLVFAFMLGWWACTRTAREMAVADPGAIVWDEVVAFWAVLWLVPGTLTMQALAFGLFRFFDAVKPGPVGWADRRFKLRAGEAIGWRQGFGILFDDLVAALCTLLVIALGQSAWRLLP